MAIVYKHTTPSGKSYIGVSASDDANIRWRNGAGYYNNRPFYNAIKKYGWDNITHEIIFSGISIDEAYAHEIELIAKFKTNNPIFGYNISEGGIGGSSGYHHTSETIEKIRASNIGKKRSNEFRKKMSKLKTGIPSTLKGTHLSEQHKQKIGDANRGHRHTEDTKRRISESTRGNKNCLGYKHTEETKQKMSKSHKTAMLGNTNGRKPVKVYDTNHNLLFTFSSRKECADYFNVRPSYISEQISGFRTFKVLNGYIFEYAK